MDAGKLRALTNFINAISIGPCIESLKQLHDGSHFIEMMKMLSGSKPRQDSDHPIQRYRQILNFLEDFYSTELKFHVDCSRIVNSADEKELAKVAALMLCASVQGDEEKVKLFVEPITRLDFTSQHEIKDIIEFVVNMEASGSQLRRNFADILHRRDDSLQEISDLIDTDIRGESVSSEMSTDSTASTIKTPMDPSSPFQKAYHASPLSPVKALLTSPHMANKISLRKMHQKIRQLETKNASERALRDDLEAEVVEKNKQIVEMESQLRELNTRLHGNKDLQDRVDELQAKQEEFEREKIQLEKLKSKLSELGAIKEERSRLDKENKEFAAESSKFHSSMNKYQRLKGEHEGVQMELRQAHREIGDLEASIVQLNKDLAASQGKCSEAGETLRQSRQIYKEKISQLEEEIAKNSSDHLGESLGIILENRITDLEAELANLRATWVEPNVHRGLKDKLSQMRQANETSESKIRSLETLLDQERWASNEKLSALRSEAVSIRKESENVTKSLQSKLESAQHLTISLKAEVKKAQDNLERERRTSAEKRVALEAEREALFVSLKAESESVRSLTECHRLETESWEKTRQDLRDSIGKLREVQSQEKLATQERVGSMESEINALRVELERARSGKEGLRAYMEAQRTELLVEKDRVEGELKERQTELMRVLRESRDDNVKAQKEIASLREEAIRKTGEAQEECQRIAAKLASDHQSELICLENSMDQVKRELEHSEESRRVQNIAGEERAAALQSECDSLAVDLERAKKGNAALEAALVSDKQEMFAERGKLVEGMEGREDHLRKELEGVQEQLKTAKSDNVSQEDRHMREVKELKEEVEGTVKGLKKAYQAEVERLQQAAVDQKKQLEEQTLGSNQLQEQLTRGSRDHEEKIALLNQEIARERSEKSSLEARMRELKKEMTDTLDKVKMESQGREDDARKDLMEVKQALSNTQSQLEILKENWRVKESELIAELEQKRQCLSTGEVELETAKTAWKGREKRLLEEVEAGKEALRRAERTGNDQGEDLQEARDRLTTAQEQWKITRERMEAESQQLSELMAVRDSKIEGLQITLDNLQAEKNKLDLDLTHSEVDFASQVAKKDGAIRRLEEELKVAREEIQRNSGKHEEKVSQMAAEIVGREGSSQAQFVDKQQAYEAEIERLKQASSDTEKKLRGRVSSAVKRVEELTKDLQESMAVAEERERRVEEIENDKTAMEERVAELMSSLADQRMDVEAMLPEKDKQIEELREKLIKSEQTTNDHHRELQSAITEKMEIEARLLGEKLEMENENGELTKRVNALEKEKELFQKTSQVAEENVTNLDKVVREKAELESALLKEKMEMEGRIADLNMQIEESTKKSGVERCKLEAENQELKLHLEELQKQQEIHEKDKEMARANLEQVIEQVEEQRISSEAEYAKLVDKNKGLGLQLVRLRERQQLLTKHIKTTEDGLRTIIEGQKEQEKNTKEQRQLSEAEMTELQEENEVLKLRVSNLEQQQRTESMSLKMTTQDLNRIREEKKGQERGAEEQMRTSELQMKKLKEENEDLKLQVTDLQQQRKSDSTSLGATVEDLSRIKKEKEEQERRAEEQMRTSETQMKKLKKENEDLHKQVISLGTEHERYQQRSTHEQSESSRLVEEHQRGHSEEVERLKGEKQQLTARMKKLMEMNRKYREGEKKTAEAKDEALRKYKEEAEAELEEVKQRYEEELEKVEARAEAQQTTLGLELDMVSNELEHTKKMLDFKNDELRDRSELLASATESLTMSRRDTSKEATTLRGSLEKERKATSLQVDKLKADLLSVKTESCNLHSQLTNKAQRDLEEAERKRAADRKEFQAKITRLEKENEALQSEMKMIEKLQGPVKRKETRNSSLSVNLSNAHTVDAGLPVERGSSEVFSDSLNEEPSPDGRDERSPQGVNESDTSAIDTPSQKLGRNLSELRLSDLSASPKLAATSRSNRSLRSSTSSTRSKGRTTIEIHMSSTSSDTELSNSPRTSLPSTTSSQLDLPETVANTLDQLCASQNSLASTLPQNKSHRTTGRANFVIVNDCDEEPEFLPWEDRIQELHRRNTLCLPHMRTSYPVETQACAPQEFREEKIKTKETSFSNGETTTTTTVSTRKKPSRKRKTDLPSINDAPSDKLRKATSHDTIPTSSRASTSNLRKAVSHQEMPPPDSIPRSSKAAKNFLVSNAGSTGRILRSSDLKSSGKVQPSQPLKPEEKAMAFDIGFSPKPSLRRRSMRHSFAKRALGRNSPKVNPEAGKENQGGDQEQQLLPPSGTKKSKRRSLGKWLGK